MSEEFKAGEVVYLKDTKFPGMVIASDEKNRLVHIEMLVRFDEVELSIIYKQKVKDDRKN